MGGDCRNFAVSGGDAGAPCAGICLSILKGTDAGDTDPLNIAYTCSQVCVFGDTTSCGYKDTPSAGFCIYAMSTSGNGDQAYCGQMCDKDSDCLDQNDNAICDTSWVQNFGRGLCSYMYGTKDGG
jgi:hypothetical protein